MASLCSGRPVFWSSIVTSAAWHCDCVEPFTLQWATGVTLATRPTLIPAIRTSESGFSPLALENTAWIVYWLANGFANFV